jgi:hypothetical protein
MYKPLRILLTFVFFVCLSMANAQGLGVATIDGSQAGTASTAKGQMWGVLDPTLKTLTYQITYAGLQGNFTGAHFHSALSGGVVQPITFAGNTAVGVWANIPDSLVQDLLLNEIYVNIHSSTAPGGEIRGTVYIRQYGFIISLDGSQAGTTSAGRGTGWAVLSSSGAGIEYGITIAGLSGTFSAAHFHSLPGGGVVKGLTFTDSTANGTWTGVADSIWSLLVKEKLYVNVHSSTAAGGEIRGSVIPVGEVGFTGSLDGASAGTASAGKGTAWLVMNSDFSMGHYEVTYARLQGSFSAAHFHIAPGGGVVQEITFTGNTASGEWNDLTDANIQALLKGNIYANIHTSTAAGGEIRGTMNYGDGVFTVSLDGAQAGTTSTGTGTAWLRFEKDSATYNVTIANLSSAFTGAHFHLLPGGGVIQPISFTDSSASGTWRIPDSIVTPLVKGKVYVNVHSSSAPGGEIRGAVHLGLNAVVTSVQRISEQVPASFNLGQNYPNPFNPSTTISFALRTSGRVSLKIYNVLGQQVAVLLDEVKSAGVYKVAFDAGALPSGVYFYRLSTGAGISETKKMVLMK